MASRNWWAEMEFVYGVGAGLLAGGAIVYIYYQTITADLTWLTNKAAALRAKAAAKLG